MATATAKSKTISLIEFVQAGGNLDTENHVIKGMRILGQESKNGRTYTEAAIRSGLPLYEGADVYVDHPDGKRVGRGYGERLGTLRNVQFSEGGLVGDLHYNPGHSKAAMVEYDAQHKTPNVGLSHNIDGRLVKRNGQSFVEEITKVKSVDLVAGPATTKSFYEQETPITEGDDMNLAELTIEQIKTGRPDLWQSMLEEQANESELKAKEQKIKDLEAKVAKYELAEQVRARKVLVDQKLTEAGIADKLPENLADLCYAEGDDAKLGKLLEEFSAILKNGAVQKTGKKPTSRDQHLDEQEGSFETDPEKRARRLRG